MKWKQSASAWNKNPFRQMQLVQATRVQASVRGWLPLAEGSMKKRGLATGAVGLLMGLSTGAMVAQYYGPPPARYAQEPGWDQVPTEFRAAQQRGFHDGIEGARRDFQNHRRPNVNNRDESRNPHFISPPDRADYRMGFRHGYDVAVRHIYDRNY
jgi:hypothetical protein